MIPTISRVLATGIIVALGVLIFLGVARINIWQIFIACTGWALAYFGDEVAALGGMTSSPSRSQYVDPVIRTVGWLFLIAAVGLLALRLPRIW